MPWVGLQCVIVVLPDHTHVCVVGLDIHLNLLLDCATLLRQRWISYAPAAGNELLLCYTLHSQDIHLQLVLNCRNVLQLCCSRYHPAAGVELCFCITSLS